jgi:hypothetical protein
VLRTAGLTAAEYARSGFGQLLARDRPRAGGRRGGGALGPPGRPRRRAARAGERSACSSPSRWRSPGRR